MSWLYRFEAKSIQSYVLSTEKIREITGASALVEDLAEHVEACRAPDDRIIMAAAGSATIEFAAEEALEHFAASWPMRLARTHPGLKVAQAWVRRSDDATADLRLLYQRLGEDPRHAPVDLPEAGPLLARSGRTGLPARPTPRSLAARTDRESMLDAATIAKLERYRSGDDLGRRLLGGSGSARCTSTMDDFGEGDVAMIHADGNAVGKALLSGTIVVADLGAFSQRLREATEAAAGNAVRALVKRLAAEGCNETQLPLRPIVLGGDDLTIVVPGRHAIPFVYQYLTAFERETKERLGTVYPGGFTACAGIAIVGSGFPLIRAYRLADDLCAAAKASLRGDVAASGLLFHRVTTALLDDWSSVMENELSARFEELDTVDHKPGALVGGPWRLADGHFDSIRSLAELTDAVAIAPRGALREWLRITRRSDARAQAHWRRMREIQRLKSAENEVFEAALRRADIDLDSGWTSQQRTPIGDALVWRAMAPAPVERLWS